MPTTKHATAMIVAPRCAEKPKSQGDTSTKVRTAASILACVASESGAWRDDMSSPPGMAAFWVMVASSLESNCILTKYDKTRASRLGVPEGLGTT